MIRIFRIVLISLFFLHSGSAAALQDQGLNSIMEIIDRAVGEYQSQATDESKSEEERQQATAAASSTVINLSRTLGKLSYSRLQCGQAEVLAEFTLRVQKMPEDFRDPMRDAFQEGFDSSKAETPLLSEDECKRLTQSRTRGDKQVEANVKQDPKAGGNKPTDQPEAREEAPPEDPRLKALRIAELTGQLSYKRKFCGDKKIHSRDFNEVINQMPEEYRADAKEAYWKGYRRGKGLNKGLHKEQCL